METIHLNWKDVPDKWALCFKEDCPLHEGCLRWHAGQAAPEEVTVCNCVTPHALKDGQCTQFASTQKVRYARGFSTIYDKVLKADFTPLRLQLTTMLSGKRYYYEYKRGERRLDPEQQERIKQLFTSYGYGDSVRFDSYEDDYVFLW